MISVKEYRQMKSDLDELNKDAVRCEVELDAVKARLLKEYGAGTVEEAKAKLDGIDREIKEASDKFNTAFEEFKRKWRDKLELPGEDIPF